MVGTLKQSYRFLWHNVFNFGNEFVTRRKGRFSPTKTIFPLPQELINFFCAFELFEFWRPSKPFSKNNIDIWQVRKPCRFNSLISWHAPAFRLRFIYINKRKISLAEAIGCDLTFNFSANVHSLENKFATFVIGFQRYPPNLFATFANNVHSHL